MSNFNIDKHLSETDNNCPDFQYVEFDILDLPEWSAEYEKEDPMYQLNDSIIRHDHDTGDEKLNQLIFEYLKPIMIVFKKKHDFNFLLQMLDSEQVAAI